MSESRRLHPTLLREYDIRGIVGETLFAEDYRAVGRAFGTILAKDGGKRVAVGYDGRLTSPDMEAALVSGLAACGLDVTRIGRGPTPMLYYASHALEADAGLMVTGSHNPPSHNGIKIMKGGRSFFGADIKALGDLAATGEFVSGKGAVAEKPMLADYVARVLSDYRGSRPLTVVWDPGNGAAGEAVQALTAKLPGRHVLINETIDGTFPAHHPDPTVEKNLAQLKETVAREKADVGIAFDGDGDRVGVVDSKGRVLWGDQLLVILASEILKELPGAPIIADVKASQVFFDEITRMGGRPIMWKTGHSLIKNKMYEEKAPLAGEMSAHIFFKHRYYGFDDALYAAIRLLSIVASGTESLTAMRDRLPAMVNTPELRFDCAEDRKFQVIEEVRERLKGAKDIQVHDIDGVRVQNKDGWWLLRASNTQAVLVARCESKTNAGLARLKAALAEQLGKSGVKLPDFT